MKNFETGYCAHCGGGIGIHQFETLNCPKGGHEAYPGQKQEWMASTYRDSGIDKLQNAAPDMLEALKNVVWNFEGKQNLTPVQQKAIEYCKAAISKAEGGKP